MTRIAVFTLSFNEAPMVPYFVQHYSFADIFAVDGGSDDGTIELLRDAGATVEVRPADRLDDLELLSIRNSEYKMARGMYDWVIVVDMDEFLYHEAGLPSLVGTYDDFDVCPTRGYMMVSEAELPEWDGRPITEIVRTGFDDSWASKAACFRPHVNINYHIGCHSCSPDTNKIGPADIKLLHYQMIGREKLRTKSRQIAARLSARNRKNNWGFHRLNYSREAAAGTAIRSALAKASLVI